MNRRQAKKAYKKKYGYNPPKIEVRFYPRYYAKIITKAMNELHSLIQRTFTAVKELISAGSDAAANVIEKIRTMPEEDFNRVMESSDLCKEVKAWAWKIRSTGQNE